MASNILVKVYPSSRRPQQFAVIDENNMDEYERLVQSFGYSLHDSTVDTPSVDKCWRMYTTKINGYDYLISKQGQNI